MRLRHTPPGGEVEGHTPRPREDPVPLHAVPLQLHTDKRGVSEQMVHAAFTNMADR